MRLLTDLLHEERRRRRREVEKFNHRGNEFSLRPFVARVQSHTCRFEKLHSLGCRVVGFKNDIIPGSLTAERAQRRSRSLTRPSRQPAIETANKWSEKTPKDLAALVSHNFYFTFVVSYFFLLLYYLRRVAKWLSHPQTTQVFLFIFTVSCHGAGQRGEFVNKK